MMVSLSKWYPILNINIHYKKYVFWVPLAIRGWVREGFSKQSHRRFVIEINECQKSQIIINAAVGSKVKLRWKVNRLVSCNGVNMLQHNRTFILQLTTVSSRLNLRAQPGIMCILINRFKWKWLSWLFYK